MLAKLFTIILSLPLAFSAPTNHHASPVTKRDFGPVNIFVPPASYSAPRTMYGRHIILNDAQGTLLSTWENYDYSRQAYLQIFRSTDHGFTWNKLSEVQDTQNGIGLPYQPFLYVLPQAIGGYPAGTILLAANSAKIIAQGQQESTQLELYASKDNGATWGFVSHITPRAGGYNGAVDVTPVWEPFLMVYNNQLICYYSDERDPNYNQKLVYTATSDLKNWGTIQNVVASSDKNARPGMAIISKIPNGFIMTYELCNPPSGLSGCPVHYRIATNPLQFQSATETLLKATDGYVLQGSPYNTWTSIGSSAGKTPNGSIVVNDGSNKDIFINRNLGASNAWQRVSTNAPPSYSRSLSVGFNPKDTVIVGGGVFNGDGSSNRVALTATDVNGCTTCS